MITACGSHGDSLHITQGGIPYTMAILATQPVFMWEASFGFVCYTVQSITLSIFFKNTHNRHPSYIPLTGELWGVFCEFKS